MSEKSGIDPERFRELSGFAATLSEQVGWSGTEAARMMSECELTSVIDVLGLCDEVSEEMGLLAQLAKSKASDIESASDSQLTTDIAATLNASLDDETGTKISAEEMRAEMADAIERGDEQELDRLTQNLWNQIASMEEEEASDFLHTLGKPAVITAIEIGGIPTCAGAVDFVGDLMVGRLDYLKDDEEPFKSYLLNERGVDISSSGEVQSYAHDRLVEFSRVSGQNARLALNSLGRVAGAPDGQDFVISAIKTIADENPREVIAVFSGDPQIGQYLSNIIAEKCSPEEIREILTPLLETTGTMSDPDGGPGVGQYSAEGVMALTKFVRDIEAAGTGVRFNWAALTKRLANYAGPEAAAAAETAQFVNDFVVVDETGDARANEAEVEEQQRTLAVAILAVNEPELAAEITAYTNGDEVITNKEWNDATPSGDGDPKLQRARERVAELLVIIKANW